MKKLLILISYSILNLILQIQKGLQKGSMKKRIIKFNILDKSDMNEITFRKPWEDEESYVFKTIFAKELTITQSHSVLSHYISYGHVAENEEVISSMNREKIIFQLQGNLSE